MGSETSRRAWVSRAVQIIEADFNRSSDTHLLRVPCPVLPASRSTSRMNPLTRRVVLNTVSRAPCSFMAYAMGGSARTPPSSRHQVVRPLFRSLLARMLGLRFIAVMPRSTSAEKIATISFYGGESHFVDSAAEMYTESARLATALGGHYMDQFTYAERATDWRGNNNIAESIFVKWPTRNMPSRDGSSSGPEQAVRLLRSGGTSVIDVCRHACALPILRPPYSTVTLPTVAFERHPNRHP